MGTPCFRLSEIPEGSVFHVRVSPGASRNKIAGEHAGALKVSISAPPEKGKANAALLRMLAKGFGIGKSELEIVSGETGRDKQVLLHGRTIEEARELLLRVIKK